MEEIYILNIIKGNTGLNIDNAWIEISELQTSISNYVIDAKVFYNGPIKNLFREANDVSYLALTKRIMKGDLTDEELIACLSIPNVPVIQQTILKIIEKRVQDPRVHTKLIEYSKCMDIRFKILGFCRIGHLAIYALKRLEYIEEFQVLYEMLSDEDKEQVAILEKAL